MLKFLLTFIGLLVWIPTLYLATHSPNETWISTSGFFGAVAPPATLIWAGIQVAYKKENLYPLAFSLALAPLLCIGGVVTAEIIRNGIWGHQYNPAGKNLSQAMTWIVWALIAALVYRSYMRPELSGESQLRSQQSQSMKFFFAALCVLVEVVFLDPSFIFAPHQWTPKWLIIGAIVFGPMLGAAALTILFTVKKKPIHLPWMKLAFKFMCSILVVMTGFNAMGILLAFVSYLLGWAILFGLLVRK